MNRNIESTTVLFFALSIILYSCTPNVTKYREVESIEDQARAAETWGGEAINEFPQITSIPTGTKPQRFTATEVTSWVEPSFTSAKPPSIEETANWIPYINTEYHFKISFPETYGSCENQKPDYLYPFYQNELLLACEKEWKIVLQISLDYHEFSVDYLRKYAPTGLELTKPTAQKIGNNTFYYYGRGGGGVWYPDQYFINLSEKVLIILFYVPSSYGNDPYEYRIIENKLLYTFTII
jgi:hypothetical protein